MNNRGQITIFIILAIIFIGSIIVFFYFRDKPFSEQDLTVSSTETITSYVIDCIKQTAYDGVHEIGQKGGYYFPSENSIYTGDTYYVLNNRYLVPNKSMVESQLGVYISVNIHLCITQFENFSKYTFHTEDIDVKTDLSEKGFLIDVNYPIIIKSEQSTVQISEFNDIAILTRANLLYNIASNYSKLFLESGGVSLTYASDIEDSYNITTTFQHFQNYTLVTLNDPNGIEWNKDYKWVFLLK